MIKTRVLDLPNTLCATCGNGLVIKGPGSRMVVRCNRGFRIETIGFPVVECNRYRREGEMSLGELEEIAWMVRTDKGGKVTGFTPPTGERRTFE